MISITEALEIVAGAAPEPAVAPLPLVEAIGQRLAAPIHAPEPSPRASNSAMDGYALRWADLEPLGEGAWLKIIGESQAGGPFAGVVGEGEAAQISTGAVIPEGADTVIRVEDTEARGGRVLIRAAERRGQNIRFEGEEIQVGDLLLPAGALLGAPEVGLLASMGIDVVEVSRAPEVCLLITGNELVATGAEIAPHQIRDSNGIMLRAAVSELGGRVLAERRVADDYAATVEALSSAEGDLILCTGGVSMGPHDHVKEASAEAGFERLFWRVAQKPGKPLFVAKRGRQLLFGLPGNPVSAFMCFKHYAAPILRALRGEGFGWPTRLIRAGEALSRGGNRSEMKRVRLVEDPNGELKAHALARQGSHMISSLTGSDGYIILDPEAPIQAGDEVTLYLL